jgi:signal transduction histidine kinase
MTTGERRSRRGILVATGVVALVVGPFATAQLTRTAERSPALLVADLAVGWSMIAAGLVISDRRPGNRIGPLAVLTGFVWFAGDLTSSASQLVAYVATVAHGWFDPLFAILILAYPAGRFVRPADRWLALGFVVVQGMWSLAKAYGARPIGWWERPTAIETVDAYVSAQGALDVLGRLETLALTVLSLGVLAVVVLRWSRASGVARRRQAPVLLAGVVLVLGITGGFLLQTVAPESARTTSGELRFVVLAILRVMVAVGLLVGILRDDAARGRIADLVVRLDGLPPTAALQASLREALGDPTLRVARWDPDRVGYRDASGSPTAAPLDGPDVAVVTLEHDGAPMLTLAFDASLRDDPGLVTAAVAAVRLAADNERLTAEVQAQLAAVQASRARLVDAQDGERRRLERDLHDGAQQRLVALRVSLGLLRRQLGDDADPAALRELAAASAEAQAAIEEIRELAGGVHPAILTEGGLGPALETLASRSVVPVTLSLDLDGRLPPAVEATAYFVVAEALTNTAKYAHARAATIAATVVQGRLRVVVDDDGAGGADIDGGRGLRGLDDRVAALGGTMTVASPAGRGTRIVAELPCGS